MKYYERRFTVDVSYEKTSEIGVAEWIASLAETGTISNVQTQFLTGYGQIWVLVEVTEGKLLQSAMKSAPASGRRAKGAEQDESE